MYIWGFNLKTIVTQMIVNAVNVNLLQVDPVSAHRERGRKRMHSTKNNSVEFVQGWL